MQSAPRWKRRRPARGPAPSRVRLLAACCAATLAASAGHPKSALAALAPGAAADETGGCPAIRLDQAVGAGFDHPRFDCPEQPAIAWKNAHLVEIDFERAGLSLVQSHRLGGEVIAAQHHIYAGSLDAARSWRSEIDGALALHEGENLDASLAFGVFETQRPVFTLRGGVGEERFARWRSNAVVGAAARLAVLDGRVRLAAGGAWSETGLHQRTEEEPWMWFYEGAGLRDRMERAGAVFSSVNAVLIDREGLTAALDLSYSDTGARFRSFESNPLSEIDYEGQTLNAAGKIEAGGFAIGFAQENHDGPDYDFDSTRFKLARGAVTLRARMGREAASHAGFAYVDENGASGEVALAMNELFPRRGGWLPDELRFAYSQRSSNQATLFGSKDARRNSVGVGVAKAGARFLTDIYVYWNARNDFSDEWDFAAAREFGADFAQSFFGENWDLSLYANMSDLKRERRARRDGAERMLSGGVSFTRKFERIPKMRVSFDAFEYEEGSIRDDYAFESHDLSIRAEADISEMLLTGERFIIDAERPLSLHLSAYRGWSAFDDAAGPEREAETRIFLLLRKSR